MSKKNSKDTFPFKLNKLTLRGIGSYLDGAEIDIRPLTILCGTNGSGKSTWINTLTLLKSATTELLSSSGKINFDSFHDICKKEKQITEIEKAGEKKERYGTIANTRISWADSDGIVNKMVESEGEEKLHGPIGTIGFYFSTGSGSVYRQAGKFSFLEDMPGGPLLKFLEKGTIAKDTKIKIFLTIPDSVNEVEGLTQGFEITFGNEETLIYEKLTKRNLFRFKVSCQDYEKEFNSNGLRDSRHKNLLDYSNKAFRRIITLLNDLLSGFFHIGAIRDIFDKDQEEYRDVNEGLVTKERSVGIKGEFTHFLVNRYCWNYMDSKQKYRLGEYYSVWLRELLGAGTCYAGADTTSGNDIVEVEKGFGPPIEFLEQYAPDKTAIPDRKYCMEEEPSENPTYYGRYTSDVLWGEGLAFGPSCFSSGFHQIAPMIVQSGLMKKFEVAAIENPEVHLHPNLQLKLTEFLLKQARSGRYFIIETHSDLIIRRVIREILEEKSIQEQIRIYFTSIEPEPHRTRSEIERLKVDEQGRISNWPKEFFGDSIKESQRLMKIVYDLDVQNEEQEDE